MRLVLAALAASLPLVACSPEYNWREIRSPEHGYAVMLPGKPATMKRGIRLGELEVSMAMQGARAGGASFTVATALLPDDSPASREKALAAMRTAMVRNIAGTERAASSTTVGVFDGNGQRLDRVGATRIEARGTVRDETVTMLAGFVARGARAHQWVALGAALDGDEAQTFLESFRLLEPAR